MPDDTWQEPTRDRTWPASGTDNVAVAAHRERQWSDQEGAAMSSTVRLKKRPAEVRTYSFSFARFPEIRDDADTLSGTPAVTGTGLTVGTPVLDAAGNRVTVSIGGGTDGTTYNVACTCGTTGGSTLVCVGRLVVSAYG